MIISKKKVFLSLKIEFDFKSCTDPESFVRGGSILTFFSVDEGKEDPNTTKSK